VREREKRKRERERERERKRQEREDHHIVEVNGAHQNDSTMKQNQSLNHRIIKTKVKEWLYFII
jgi:hypothetical protein